MSDAEDWESLRAHVAALQTGLRDGARNTLLDEWNRQSEAVTPSLLGRVWRALAGRRSETRNPAGNEDLRRLARMLILGTPD